MEPPFRQGGLRHVIQVAFPLVLATSGHAFRLFADRVMLAKYSPEAIAASMPSGLLCFTFMAFFIGTVGYVNTFVAQFFGAKQEKSAGLAVWQGIYLAALGGVVVAGTSFFAEPIFTWMNHAPAVQAEEVRYFKVLAWLAFPGIALSSVNAFWSGRGLTRVVMGIELFCAAVNIGLNALLIFGYWGFPEMGIVGAGLATGLANTAGFILALWLFLRRRNRKLFCTWPDKLFNAPLLRNIIRYGLPSGLQFGFDLLAFNTFIAFLGMYGALELEAANIAFSLNAMAFIPIIGMGIAVSVLVGQAIGGNDIPFAKRAVRSGFYLALLYNATIGIIFILFPEAAVGVFAREGDLAQVETLAIARRCLNFVVAYLLFDAVYVVYSHGVRGAGDTLFSLWASQCLVWGTLVTPCYIALKMGGTFWMLWTILVVHVFLAASLFFFRYLGGKWQHMKVIDTGPELDAIAECDIQADRGI